MQETETQLWPVLVEMETLWLGVVTPRSSNNVHHLSLLSAFHYTGLNSDRDSPHDGKKKVALLDPFSSRLRRKKKALSHRFLSVSPQRTMFGSKQVI